MRSMPLAHLPKFEDRTYITGNDNNKGNASEGSPDKGDVPMLRTFPLPIPPAVPADAKPAKPNLFRRLYAALIASRQRRAEREIAHYLARSGLKFTDAVERDVERRFFHHRSV